MRLTEGSNMNDKCGYVQGQVGSTLIGTWRERRMSQILKRFKELLIRWLELDKLDLRLVDVERHFVTKRDAAGKVTETLAEKAAERDGRPLPKMRRSRSWDQQRRFLEADSAARAIEKVRKGAEN